MPERSAWRVWATRPTQQNKSWCHLLQQEGLGVVEAPLLAIEPVSDPQLVQSVRNLILNFDQFQKVIFVSQNAVDNAFSWLEDYWPQLPSGIEWFAVGKKTAEVASARGVNVVAVDGAMNSDELLALPAMQNVWGQKILICRGVGGLPRLGEVLHQRGAMVRFCELYERRLPASAPKDVQVALSASAERDIVPLFSGETLQNLVQMIDSFAVGKRDLSLVVPGRRVSELARAASFTQVITAPNASEAAMLATIIGHIDGR